MAKLTTATKYWLNQSFMFENGNCEGIDCSCCVLEVPRGTVNACSDTDIFQLMVIHVSVEFVVVKKRLWCCRTWVQWWWWWSWCCSWTTRRSWMLVNLWCEVVSLYWVCQPVVLYCLTFVVIGQKHSSCQCKNALKLTYSNVEFQNFPR